MPESTFLQTSGTIQMPTMMLIVMTSAIVTYSRAPMPSEDPKLKPIAEIAKTAHVDEKYLDEKGVFRLEDANLLAYAHGQYFSLGKKLGKFGYSVRKKQSRKKKRKK